MCIGLVSIFNLLFATLIINNITGMNIKVNYLGMADINNKINVDHQEAARPQPGARSSSYSRRSLLLVPVCIGIGSFYIN